MAYYSGLDGELWFKKGSKFERLGKVRNWSFSQSQAVLETTALGDTDRTLVDGVRSLSGSCSLFYYAADDQVKYGAEDLLKRIMKPYNNVGDGSPGVAPGAKDLGETIRSGKVAFKLAVDKYRSGMNDHNYNITGDENGATSGEGHEERFVWIQAWITNFTMTMSVGEVLSADLTFESDGAAVENKFSTYN